MAPQPKRKHSAKRKGTRVTSKNVKALPKLIKCKNCGKSKLQHKVCRYCGK